MKRQVLLEGKIEGNVEGKVEVARVALVVKRLVFFQKLVDKEDRWC